VSKVLKSDLPKAAGFLTVAAALAFLLLCMLLPLVARAGAATEFSSTNRAFFNMAALATLLLSGGATALRLKLRASGQAGFPCFAALISAATATLLLASLFGWLAL
jgi:hypothetical protein